MELRAWKIFRSTNLQQRKPTSKSSFESVLKMAEWAGAYEDRPGPWDDKGIPNAYNFLKVCYMLR